MNKVQLIGNIVRKPDLRITMKGVKVCTFHVITDREWEVNGERKSESIRHVCVAWDRLAEICHDLLDKGYLVYVDGRLNHREFVTPQNTREKESNIIVNEMILLNRGSRTGRRNRGDRDG